VIVHQPGGEGQPIRTILAGPQGAKYEEFAMLICDVVRHVVAGFRVTEDGVFEWIEKERKKPTTDPTTEWESPRGSE
jgi:hypothetical protein